MNKPRGISSPDRMGGVRNALRAAVLLVLASCSQDTLKPICGNVGQSKCYAVPGVTSWVPEGIDEYNLSEIREKGGVGECDIGVPVCDRDNKIISCDGEVEPEKEICDNKDNDCDGSIDEGVDVELGCMVYGECAGSQPECIEGEEVCDYPDTVELPNEISCDGKDNDCDGRVDENTTPEALCFDGEFWQATNGVCRAGQEVCTDGVVSCDGQVIPSREICNNKDDDCDGVIDEVTGGVTPGHDIAIAIDNSGTMCEEILSVLGALDAYIDQYAGDARYKFAIILMASQEDGHVELVQDFTDITTARSVLQTTNCLGSGSEASLDVLYRACNYLDDDLGLSWRSEASPLVFSFTDELPQTYMSPPINAGIVTDKCLENGVRPIQWSDHRSEFEQMVLRANGMHFQLSDSFDQILSDLNSVFTTSCWDEE